MEHEEYTFGFQILDIQKYFCWNSYGKIDRIKTAKSLINNESLSVSARYNLARHYGFERDFLFLWDKMSIAEKDYANNWEILMVNELGLSMGSQELLRIRFKFLRMHLGIP
ncbi:hypothetical protein TNCT_402861 [Trichonephila clavata]|uniref:Uncharacterized protein n=1 Tax=Trichonephila clavata TaxID=2740835 RepID=A0A8X6G401_TRICU|nr:hypothetical protein TNCT_402861 [Trichonephila clavata]